MLYGQALSQLSVYCDKTRYTSSYLSIIVYSK